MSELEITLAIIAMQAIGNLWGGITIIRSILHERRMEQYIERLEANREMELQR